MSYSYDKHPRSVNGAGAATVAQAGMGGGLAGPDLAITVARAGGLGTLGWVPADWLHKSIRRMRDEAGDRAVAVNLLMPFVGRRDVEVCVDSRIDAAVIAFGRCPPVVDRTALYAGESVLRMDSVISARQAVADLAGS
jgi:NAD(P)H-dependent flavin oxidoreductase YrpB (nitropropane dioxygenase family)